MTDHHPGATLTLAVIDLSGAMLASPDARRRCRDVVIVLSYLAVAALTAGPAPRDLATNVPQGQESVGTVPLLNVWTVAWNARSVARGFAGYWDAGFFYPLEEPLALCETQPTTVAVAPIVWGFGLLRPITPTCC